MNSTKSGSKLALKNRKQVKSAGRAVKGLRALQKRIAQRQQGKSRISLSEFKSAIRTGRR